MKKIVVAMMILGSGVKAFACAGCFDVFPEITVLSESSAEELTTSIPEFLDETKKIRLSEISCVKPNLFGAEDIKPSCVFIGLMSHPEDDHEIGVELTGVNALVLYNQLVNHTVEVDGRVDDEWQREGYRTKVILVNQTEDYSRISIPNILLGELSCPVVKGKARCEIELRSVSAVNVLAQ